MVCRKIKEKDLQDQRESLTRSKVWAEKKRVYIGNRRAETENNCKTH